MCLIKSLKYEIDIVGVPMPTSTIGNLEEGLHVPPKFPKESIGLVVSPLGNF